jgi:hypothetical protein
MIDHLDRAGDAVVLAPAAEPTPVATLQRRATRRHRRRLAVSVAAPVCALVLAIAVAANALDGSKNGAVTVVAPSSTLAPVPTSVAAVVTPTTAASAAGTTTTLSPASTTTVVTAHPSAPVTTVPSTVPQNNGGGGGSGQGGGGVIKNGPPNVVTSEQLAAAQSLWSAHGSANYTFDIYYGPGQAVSYEDPGYQVTVRNGVITKTSPLGHEISGWPTPAAQTVPELLGYIQGVLANTNSNVLVGGHFDPQLGYPTGIGFAAANPFHPVWNYAITSMHLDT